MYKEVEGVLLSERLQHLVLNPGWVSADSLEMTVYLSFPEAVMPLDLRSMCFSTASKAAWRVGSSGSG